MRNSWPILLALLLVAPASAQDEAPVEEAEVVPVDDPAAGAATPEESGTGMVEETSEEPAEDTAAEDAEEPWQLYAGVDYVMNTLSVSGRPAESTNEFDTGMYRLRVGRRMFEMVGIEAHAGIDNGGDGPGEVQTDSYFGAFIVPTATLFETLELAFPVGYAFTGIGSGDDTEDVDSVAYGIDAELPVRAFGDTLPDLRLTAGWMVYYQDRDGRLYGANVGLRYDFTAEGFGNPFAGLRGLWPFGGDEPAETAE